MKNDSDKDNEFTIITIMPRIKKFIISTIDGQKDSYKRMNEKDQKSLHALILLNVFDIVFIIGTYYKGSLSTESFFMDKLLLYIDPFPEAISVCVYCVSKIIDFIYNYFWCIIMWVLLYKLGRLYFRFYKENGRGMGPIIMTKLLSNAVAPRKLGIAYLLVFVLHIGWLTNITYDMLKHSCSSCFPFIVALGGIMVLVSFFPDAKSKNNPEARKIYVSGISAFSWPQKNQKIDKMNIIPLVKMITPENTKDLKEAKLIILLSSMYQSRDYVIKAFKRDVRDEMPESGENEKELYSKMDEAYSKYCNATKDPEKKEDDSIEKSVRQSKSQPSEPLREETVVPIEITKELLTSTIKAFATYIVKGSKKDSDEKDSNVKDSNEEERSAYIQTMESYIKDLKIEFTEYCDYNDYQTCFDIMDRKLDEREQNDDDVQLIFNMSSGTALISSVMTLFSVDPDRKLFYYRQYPDSQESTPKMMEIDKDRLPILRVLSKTIDKMG